MTTKNTTFFEDGYIDAKSGKKPRPPNVWQGSCVDQQRYMEGYIACRHDEEAAIMPGHEYVGGRSEMKEVNEKAFVAIDSGKQFTFEKLVAVVIKPGANNYAELFKDISFGIASCSFTALIFIGLLK